MTQINCSREAFKDNQYILVAQVKQVFYLKIKTKPTGSLNDLNNATLHIDGQSTVVDAPPDIIDVPDEDDDIISDEDALPYDLADSDVEDLINMSSADVARSHGGDGGGDDRPLPAFVTHGCGGCFATKAKGFEDPDHLDKVYKVVKVLYGLHQAPRAWYDTLANYLLHNGFQIGKIDQTLFIKRKQGHILLVQIYVDDIIFRSTKKELCDEFEKLMKDNQDKYVHEILRKYNYTDVKSASTPTDLEKPLVQDGDAADVSGALQQDIPIHPSAAVKENL
ncbi:putative ribonuclease H-like domain-containing protein [Tanacetum coccineum]